jgi:hypothetical protein
MRTEVVTQQNDAVFTTFERAQKARTFYVELMCIALSLFPYVCNLVLASEHSDEFIKLEIEVFQ